MTLELNKIYHGNNLSLIKQLDENSIDLTVTSPPYDNLRTYNEFTWDFEGLVKELYRVTKTGGAIVWIINDATINGSETASSFKQALFFIECGFNLHDTMIWRKDTCGLPSKTRYAQCFEYMFVFTKGKPNTFNPIQDRPNKYAGNKIHGTYRDKHGEMHKREGAWAEHVIPEVGARFNVWDISTEKKNKTGHPAVFPLSLARDHILSWSNPDDIILDPFMGSGTVALACKETERNYIGFEISFEYIELANSRLNKEKEIKYK